MININFYNKYNSIKFAPIMKYFYLSLMVLAFACQNASKTNILTSKDFNDKINSGGNIQILDVRTEEEFNEGHILNAINIDVNSDNFEAKVGQLYKDIPTLVYCRSGARSSNAIEIMSKMGFKELSNLEGGIVQWSKDQLPVTPPSQAKEKYIGDDIATFKEAIKGSKLIMADFNAEWCGPCKMMKPYVELFKETKKDDVIIYAIDTDVHQALSNEYKIESLPTIMLFKNNEMVYQNIGYMSKENLEAVINQFK
jgi:thioredoxin 1